MKRIFASLVLLCGTIGMVFAQKAAPEVSKKQDLAFFRLSYYGWDIPSKALGSIDTQLQKVFLDMGRFNLIGMKQRIAGADITTFLDTITASKEKDFVLPKKVQLGEEFLTAAEFKRLTQAYIVAVPVVNNLTTEIKKDGNYAARLNVAISFIDVAENKIVGIADINTSATAKTRNDAVAEAIGAIPTQTQYEVRKIEQFRNRTYVTKLEGSQLTMKFGKDMGVKVGDEYAVMGMRSVGGEEELAEVGLAIVKEAGEKSSTSTLLFSDAKVAINTPLYEIARLGYDAELYLKLLIGQSLEIWDVEGSAVDIVPGLKVTMARGFYDLRPFTAFQFPISGQRTGTYWNNILANWLFGAEYVLVMDRLSLAPSGALGIGASYWKSTSSGYQSEPVLTHLGINAGGRASYLITRDIRINAEAGLEYWLGIRDKYSSYGGLNVTVSGSYKL